MCIRDSIDPQGYYDLVEKVGMKREEREKSIENVINVLKEKLGEQGIQAEIDGRPKHFYSIYRKMHQPVSYTHLDVYKRQVRFPAGRPLAPAGPGSAA